MFAITPRLTLRPGWPEDAPALARAIGNESVVRHLARVPWPYRLADAEWFLALPRGPHDARFVIVPREDGGRIIGGIALEPMEGGTWELGYWLTPAAWGRGYATEAGRAVIDIARHALGAARLVATPHADNAASAHVLAKLGFRETGRSRHFALARGEEVPCIDLVLDLRAADRVALAA